MSLSGNDARAPELYIIINTDKMMTRTARNKISLNDEHPQEAASPSRNWRLGDEFLHPLTSKTARNKFTLNDEHPQEAASPSRNWKPGDEFLHPFTSGVYTWSDSSRHGLSQQGVWVSFWTPKPSKSTPQDTQNIL